MSHLRGKSVKEIHTVTTGELEVVECEITENSKIIGKQLKEIADAGNFLVLMIKTKDAQSYEIVNGNTTITAGSHLVLITKSDNSKKVLSYFSGSTE